MAYVYLASLAWLFVFSFFSIVHNTAQESEMNAFGINLFLDVVYQT
jgi:hypothetical protein